MSDTTILDQKCYKDKDYNVFTLDIMPLNQDSWESEIKDGWVEITREEMIYLTQPPSVYHEMINGKWIITEEKQEQKRQDIITQNTSKRAELIKEATTEIDTLQDELDLEMSDDLEATEKSLKDWKKYRVLLNKLDVTQEDLIFPTKPE